MTDDKITIPGETRINSGVRREIEKQYFEKLNKSIIFVA